MEESDSDVLEGEIMRTRKKRKQNIIEIDEMQTTQQDVVLSKRGITFTEFLLTYIELY